MSFTACITEIQKAAGRALSDDELDDLLTELRKRQRQRQLSSKADGLDQAVLDAADDYAREMADAAAIEKRNAAINLKRRLDALDFVRSQFKDDYALGLESLLVGVNRARVGSRFSAAAEQNQLKSYYLGGFTADVERAGLWNVFVSGELDRDISRALWAKEAGGAAQGVPREAAQLADIIGKWQDVARVDANKAGAWIKKMPGYIVRQSHDQFKIQHAGFDVYKADILTRLDMEKTLDGERDADGFLKAVFDGLVSGVHLKTSSQPAFKGPRNIAKKASAERVLHFKSADDWFDYNQKYGTGSLREALLRGFEVNAQNTGLMRKFGVNPEANLDRIVKDLAKDIADPVKKRAFMSAANSRIKNQLAELDGSTRNPVNHTGARLASNIRVVQRMAKLGASLLSQFGDIPLYASEMRYQGRTMLGGLGESMGNIFKGRGSAETREMASLLGVVNDMMSGEITARFSIADDDLPGAMTKAQRFFFKWNGMTWWTDAQRRGAVMGMAHRLAYHKQAAYDELDPDITRTLRLFAINEPEWNIIRASASKMADGREYVVPESIMAVPDAKFTALLAGQGVNPTPKRIADLKREIADKVRAYYIDRASFATIMPDQRTRALMQRGTKPGTIEGELMRFLGELKAFPISVIQKSMGREIYGRGSNSLGEALRNGNGEMLGMAQLLVWTTAFGYISMSAKDILKGRNPRDAWGEDGINFKTFMAALVQGGGAGIYGDFLFGEVKNRFGGGLLSTLAGPTLGTVEDIADLYGRVRDGDDAAAASFRLLISSTPFANLFYTRIALDYLFLHQISEWLNPGSLRRMERRVEKENAQTFWLRPSEAVR